VAARHLGRGYFCPWDVLWALDRKRSRPIGKGDVMISFVAGLMLVPITVGLIFMLAYLDLHGYIEEPNLIAFAAGAFASLACFAIFVWKAMG